MSGNLRLNGTTSGYSELTAPAVAGDQTFTFPAVGGVLATIPAGGQVVGYQQGMWLPDFHSSTQTSQWITNGLAQTSSGATTAPLVSGFSATFSRIGQMVTLHSLIYFKATSGTASDAGSMAWTGLPYIASNANQTIIPEGDANALCGYVGSCYMTSLNTAVVTSGGWSVIPYVFHNALDKVALVRSNGGGGGATALGANALAADNGASVYQMMTVTYRTDDTTWVPQPGRTAGLTSS
jgi:hypothetical protein